MDETIKQIFEAILAGDAQETEKYVKVALGTQLDPTIVLNRGMIAAMREVGARFEAGEYFVPEMLIGARAMQRGMAILKPYLQQGHVSPLGKVVIGTVNGDLHDIGKNLVAMMLEGAGFEITDLGANVPVEKFVESVQAVQPHIVALSALLTTTMPAMKTTLEAFNEAGLRKKIKVIVGGAPLNEAYAKQIGADGYAPDASRAVGLAQSLLG